MSHMEPALAAATRARIAQEHASRISRERARAEGIAVPDPHPGAVDPRDQGPDVGPSFQHRPAGRLETVYAVDPTQPKGPRIRRARTKDPLRRMVKVGAIDYRLYVAADSFREDLERSEGGRDMGEALARALSRAATDTPSPAPAPWLRSNHMAPGQWSAQRRVQRAWREAIGIIAGGVFSWVVISCGTLTDYATCKGIPRADATQTLKDALARLADFYAIGDVTPPPEWELDAANPIGA
ncbi:hypothetical protein [Roseomonas xinghualingensis]|uniref:hypothetical protein n=1 Tax=Roseomonas xinghualingensis TaxID=2986475 RepID=UPI003672A7BC